jgi:hypothetical protein
VAVIRFVPGFGFPLRLAGASFAALILLSALNVGEVQAASASCSPRDRAASRPERCDLQLPSGTRFCP